MKTTDTTPTVAATVILRIRNWMATRLRAGHSTRQLALQIGLGKSTLATWRDPKWNPTLSTIIALERQMREDKRHGLFTG